MRRFGGTRRRFKCQAGGRLHLEGLEARALLAADWQNPSNPFDVDGDDGPNAVTPLDALIVVNELQSRTASSPLTGMLPDLGPEEGSPPPFLDVNGDNVVSPLDALLVINQLGGESEEPTSSSFAGTTDSVMAGTFAAAANFVVTSDTLVNAVTQHGQAQPDIAASPDGRAVVVWGSFAQDGSSWGVYAQRYNAIGEKAGGELRVNSHTNGNQRDPAIAMFAEGGFVVVWQSLGQDGSSWGVVGRLFNADGNAVSNEFVVSQTTQGLQWHPDVAVLAGGGFVVSWDGRGAGDSDGVFTRTFSAAGVASSAEHPANSTTRGPQGNSAVTAFGTGSDFAVAWHGKGTGDDVGVFMRDSRGTSEVLVNPHESGLQTKVAISGNTQGEVVVAWQEFPEPAGGTGVRARKFTLNLLTTSNLLVSSTGVLTVNQTGIGPQDGPAVAILADGRFAVSWYGKGTADNVGIYHRLFSSVGVAESAEQLANTTTQGSQVRPAVANVAGDYVVVWTGRGEEDKRGIFARLFDVANSGNQPPTLVQPIPNQQVNAGSPFSFNVAAFFQDPDAGDSLTYTATNLAGGTLPAWLSFNTLTGQFSGTPTATDIGTTPIRVRATDESAAFVTDDFDLVVNPVNQAPQITTPIPNQSATTGSAFALDVTSAFTDPDGDTMTFTTSTLPAWLSFNAATQAFSGTPSTADVGSTDVSVTATDPGGLFVTDTFVLTVTAPNSSPVVLTPIADQTLVVGQLLNLNIASNFNDPDPGDTLSYSATQLGGAALPAWLSFNGSTGLFSGTPAIGDVGTIQVVVTAMDPDNASVTDTFSITVNSSTNSPPVLFDQSFRVAPSAVVGTAVGTVQASEPDQDPITFEITAGNLAGAFAINSATGAITVADATALAGLTQATLAVRASDDGSPSLSDSGTVTIFVTAAELVAMYSVDVVSPSGDPITSIVAGGNFELRVFVQDVRAAAEGIFSAFTDLVYDSDVVSTNGSIVHSSTYNGGTAGTTTTVGLVDEAGGVDGLSPLGSARFEVFRIAMQAGTTPGTAFFYTDVADNSITHPTLVFNSSDNLATNLIGFGNATLNITAPTALRGGADSPHANSDSESEETRAEQMIARIFAQESMWL